MSPSHCPACGKSAAGKFCPSCGTPLAEAPAPAAAPVPAAEAAAPRRPWLPIAIAAAVIVGLAGMAAAALFALGGDPDEPANAAAAAPRAASVDEVRLSAQNLYSPLEDRGLTALLPAGWRKRPASDETLELGLTATSAQDRGASVTLGVLGGSSASLVARARALRDERRRLEGYGEESFRRISLAGKRPAWKLQYSAGGRSTVEYVWEACGRHLTVSGTAPEEHFTNLAARYGVVARGLQPEC